MNFLEFSTYSILSSGNKGNFFSFFLSHKDVFISFFLTLFHDCHYSVFQHTYSLFHIFYSAADFFSSVFCISVIVLLISVCLFLKSFSSLLNISCILGLCLHFYSQILDHLYPHILSFLSVRLPVLFSFICSCGF